MGISFKKSIFTFLVILTKWRFMGIIITKRWGNIAVLKKSKNICKLDKKLLSLQKNKATIKYGYKKNENFSGCAL